MKKIVIALAALALALPSYAKEIGRYHQSARALGMGGAFTAVADDEGALFYNPAGLTRVSEWHLGVVNLGFKVNENSVDFFNDFEDIDSDSTAEVSNLLRDYIGDQIHLGLDFMPYYVNTNFGLAILGRMDVDLTPHNLANPEMQVEADSSIGGHVGYAHTFGNFAVGGAAKFINSQSLNTVYEAKVIASDNFEDVVEDDMVSKTGFGLDLGMMYKFDTMFEPTVALAAINLVEPRTDGLDAYTRHYNLGVSGKYQAGPVALTGALDLVDVTKELGTDNDMAKRIMMGIEAKLPKILTLRAGIHQGYTTFGATVDLWVLHLTYARYYEETGVEAGDDPDLRQMIQVNFGF